MSKRARPKKQVRRENVAPQRREVPDQDAGTDVARESPSKHCDEYIHDFTAPSCLRFFLLINRMPAVDVMLYREHAPMPRLFATTREGTRVRVVMASRMGDVGITPKLDAEDGYKLRVMVADLTDFGDAP